MYKCPKCGSTESFAVYGTLTIPNRWFNVDSDGKVIDAGTDLESASYIEYEAEDKITCDNCGYEAYEDEFEE